jgi:hypothetical protein
MRKRFRLSGVGGNTSTSTSGKVTREELCLVHRMLTEPVASGRGRPLDPRLHSAWIEWETVSPKPSYLALSRKHYNNRRYRDTVKKGIQRLHRLLEEKISRPS